MLRNYFVIATRNLLNSKFYACINIVGLSIGIACCLVLALIVLDQLSFDRDNINVNHIYRVVHRENNGAESVNVATTQGVLGIELQRNFAEVKEATRVAFTQESIMIEGHETMERKITAVDPSFFSIFTVPMKKAVITKSPLPVDGILISESEATALFGKNDALGQVIKIKDLAEFKVVGVFQDMIRSHIRSGYIISFSWIEKTQPQATSWHFNSYYNYVLLSPDKNISGFNEKLNAFVHRYTPESWKSYEYFLQPLPEIYLDSSFHNNPNLAIGKTYSFALVMVGFIILVLACFNYMNMATARYSRRALEVGIRKVMGAHRVQLIAQFLTESFIICTFSFSLAILWADLALPFFQAFTNTSQTEMIRFNMSNFFNDYKMVLGLVASNFLLAMAAGSYPAFFLSRFIPVAVLKGQRISDTSRRLRRTLVSFQFAITAILLILVAMIFKQTQFMKAKDLGFRKEGLLFFAAVRNPGLSPASFKYELQKIAGVNQVASASILPGRLINTTNLRLANTPDEESIKIGFVSVDHDYISTLGLTLLAGRNFNVIGSDKDKGIIINEEAAQTFGWTPEQAIGKRVAGFIFSDSLPGEIIGIVKNYHVSSVRKKILPLALNYKPDNNRYVARLDGADFAAIRDKVKARIQTLVPNTPSEPVLIDDYLDSVYMLEEKLGQLLTFFSVLAVIIGCLGLYALAAYEGEQRVKELGIRKIMGATSPQLLVMLSVNFLKPVLISMIIAMPLAYLVGNLWLRTFSYRASWSLEIFLQSAIWIIVLGWFTVLSQGIRASRLNPADALRHE
jgi:putative ABC transport system permease protein